ncbi:ABC transporter permease subunit [Sporosarcina sp. YIM B06819]|uniref:ABC transporter permease subunit n=1 Tax=Sporosarcina sp. YIM B06819 TaxID=3081769 RepID=UPI00298C268C|nr:ABC transporter permease subunit [Sporosarcina sp. YIM B06819]
MNIYVHELKSYSKTTLLWTVTLVLAVVLFMSIYPAFTKDVASFKTMLEGVPEAVRHAIGLEVDQFFSLVGFYSYILLYLKMLGAIQAISLGIGILSKEVRDKTADFLLTKPVSRVDILLAKMMAAFTCILVTNVIYVMASLLIVSLVTTEPFHRQTLILLSLTVFLLQLVFLALGFMIAVVVQKIKSVLSVSLGTVFLLFFISLFGSATGDGLLRYLTPFQYVEPAYILRNQTYEWGFLLLGSLILIVSIAVSYIVYRKKDIPSV